jgi:soluble lytic murein transglycosylase
MRALGALALGGFAVGLTEFVVMGLLPEMARDLLPADYARSSAGAIGLMQLQPATAKGIALRTGGSKFVLSDLYDPELNVRYGSWYLHHLMTKYGDERLALAAYNAGQQNVDRWRANGQEIQFPETRAYVDKVERLRAIYRRAYAEELGYG